MNGYLIASPRAMLSSARFITEDHFGSPQILLHGCYTDVFILLPCHATHLYVTLWMDIRLHSKNTRNVINNSSSNFPAIYAALLGFHTFTGCDYTCSFLRKVKSRPFTSHQLPQITSLPLLNSMHALFMEPVMSKKTMKLDFWSSTNYMLQINVTNHWIK